LRADCPRHLVPDKAIAGWTGLRDNTGMGRDE